MKGKLALIFAVVAGIFFTSCGEEQTAQTYDYEKADSLSVDYLKELKTVRNDITDVGKLNILLMESGYKYNASVIQSASRASGLSGRKAQAMGIGAYGADINYLVVNGQNQEAVNHLNAILQLAEKLGIQSAFDEEIMNSVVEQDTVLNVRKKTNLISKAYRKAEDNLYSEDRAQLVTLMVAGGWIESMYIVTNLIKEKAPSADVKAEVWDQASNYDKVVKMLEIYKDNQECAAVLSDLQSVEVQIKGFTASLGGINTQKIDTLHTAISSLRKKIAG